jgi:Holliday junction resolvase RusA-like endonuclease
MKPLKIPIKCPSWNEFNNRRVHWAVHKKKREEIMNAVGYAIYENENWKNISFSQKVNIEIEAHFKNSNRRDPDNLYIKPILDFLVKRGILEDDSGKYINSIKYKVKTKQQENCILLTIHI